MNLVVSPLDGTARFLKKLGRRAYELGRGSVGRDIVAPLDGTTPAILLKREVDHSTYLLLCRLLDRLSLH